MNEWRPRTEAAAHYLCEEVVSIRSAAADADVAQLFSGLKDTLCTHMEYSLVWSSVIAISGRVYSLGSNFLDYNNPF